jgi:hypothetical protein
MRIPPSTMQTGSQTAIERHSMTHLRTSIVRSHTVISNSDLPRVISRRSFAQLLEETRRRSRCYSQPILFVPDRKTTIYTTPADVFITPPPRSSSLIAKARGRDPIEELEELAQHVWVANALSVSRSPSRCGFSTLAGNISPSGSSQELLCISPANRRITSTSARRDHSLLSCITLPEIMITRPSSESMIVCDVLSDDDVGQWADEHSQCGRKDCTSDTSVDYSDADSEPSSLFIAESIIDTDSISTSPPGSPLAGDSLVRHLMSRPSVVVLSLVDGSLSVKHI